jgi:hypothetical protein
VSTEDKFEGKRASSHDRSGKRWILLRKKEHGSESMLDAILFLEFAKLLRCDGMLII